MSGSDGRFDLLTVLLAMAVVTLALRLGGFWLMGHVPLTGRVRRMLDALPGSVIMATVLPVAVKSGPVAMIAIAAALAVMIVRRNDFLAVVTAVLVAAALRASGLG
jgi:uncharacterized membrane protein